MLTPEQVEELTATLGQVKAMQIEIMDRLAAKNLAPKDDTLELFRLLAQMRTIIDPALERTHDEQVELGRPSSA